MRPALRVVKREKRLLAGVARVEAHNDAVAALAVLHDDQRLVIEHGEHISIYETGNKRISGIAQSSGTFPSFKDDEGGIVQLTSLKLLR